MAENMSQLRMRLRRERDWNAHLLSELRDLREAAWPRWSTSLQGGCPYAEPPEYTTVRFVKDGYRFLAVRVGDSWYTTSTLSDEDADNASFDAVRQIETWDRIRAVSTQVEVAVRWEPLGSQPRDHAG